MVIYGHVNSAAGNIDIKWQGKLERKEIKGKLGIYWNWIVLCELLQMFLPSTAMHDMCLLQYHIMKIIDIQ